MKTWQNTEQQYGLISIFLHWSMALLCIGLVFIGLSMTNMPDSDDKWWLYSLHKSLGLLLLGLLLLRILWRLSQIQPALPKQMKRWEIFAAHATHISLYALMMILPVSGYLDSVAGGYKTQFFGANVPLLVAQDKPLAELALAVHRYASYWLYVLFALHVSAALKHHFILRDKLLQRILP